MDVAKLKRQGYIRQKDKEYFTVRIKIQSGNINSEQMNKISEIAQKYGKNYAGLTTRLNIEVPWIKLEYLEEVKAELQQVGLAPGGTGPTVRPIVACKGTICAHGLGDTQELCRELDERFYGRDVGAKFKIGIVGCPNNCAKAQLNDLGFMGQCQPRLDKSLCTGCGRCTAVCKVKAITIEEKKAEINEVKCIKCGKCVQNCSFGAITASKQGFTPYLGGRFGRAYKIGESAGRILSAEEAVEFTGRLIEYYMANSVKGERVSHMVNRIGMEKVMESL